MNWKFLKSKGCCKRACSHAAELCTPSCRMWKRRVNLSWFSKRSKGNVIYKIQGSSGMNSLYSFQRWCTFTAMCTNYSVSTFQWPYLFLKAPRAQAARASTSLFCCLALAFFSNWCKSTRLELRAFQVFRAFWAFQFQAFWDFWIFRAFRAFLAFLASSLSSFLSLSSLLSLLVSSLLILLNLPSFSGFSSFSSF